MKDVSDAWRSIDWKALKGLRSRFLALEKEGCADYWRTREELAGYDLTFGERIGWKWDHVLGELRTRGWMPPGGTVVDWGCGTGVAGRRVAAAFPGVFTRLLLVDRSARARQFALERAREGLPGLAVEALGPEAEIAAPDLLVISHVLNELPAPGDLLALAARARAVIWVEPGTSHVAGLLVKAREVLLAGEGEPRLRPVAPCPHDGGCGMLEEVNERHWCHHFAKPPREVFQDGNWSRFAKTLEIDLRTLPLSYLVLDREYLPEEATTRLIGEPRCYKGFLRLLCCERSGVTEVMLQKRDAADLYKAISKDAGSLYRLEKEERGRVVGGKRLV